MNNTYGNRLKKYQKIQKKNSQEIKSIFPLNQYIRDKIKPNNPRGLNKIEVNRRDIFHLSKNSNPLFYSYNRSQLSNSKYEYNKNNMNKISNHSLYDSNKKKIINPEINNHNFVQFKSEHLNKNNYREVNNKRNLTLFTMNNFYRAYNSNENYKVDRRIKNGEEYIIKKRINNTFQRNYNNENTFGNHYLAYSTNLNNYRDNNFNYININVNKSLNFKKYNDSKNSPSIEYKNFDYKVNNYNKNNYIKKSDIEKYNTTTSKTQYTHYLKRYMTNNYFLTENNEEKNSNINNRYESHSPSYINQKIIKSPNINRRNDQYISNKNMNKANTNINNNLKKNELLLLIKLNIENKNKENLSRIKSIIEKSSNNHNFYQLDLKKDMISNKINESTGKKEKNNIIKKRSCNLSMFKKKKIKFYSREEKKEDNFNGDINRDGMIYENNFFATSPINLNKKNKPNLLINNRVKDNNKIQSLVASYNSFINKEKEDDFRSTSRQKISVNKLSRRETQHTSYLNNNKDLKNLKIKLYKRKKIDIKHINNDNNDTISLSYSKEQNLSNSFKNKDNGEIYLPLSIENFNIQYNIYNKKLVINDNNLNNENKFNKNNIINIEDDDDYQLTKEIILLKRGLSKNSELKNEIKKKLKELRPKRIYQLSLLGNKNVYKKKISNYKINLKF